MTNYLKKVTIQIIQLICYFWHHVLILFKQDIKKYLLGMTVVSPGGAVMVTGMLTPVGPTLVLFFRLSLSSGFSSVGDWRGLVARLSVPVGLPL